MAELFGADNYLTGLAGYASSATPLLDSYASMAMPAISTLPTSAMTNIAGAVAEEGADAASSSLPNLMTVGKGLTNSSAPTITNAIKQFGVYDPSAGAASSSWFGDTMKYLNDNSKAIESGTKLLGAAGTLYSQQQAAGLAKQALADSRANTAYNRARQAEGDRRLQDASDKVFGRGA